jgi:hypothetical protein
MAEPTLLEMMQGLMDLMRKMTENQEKMPARTAKAWHSDGRKRSHPGESC